MNRISKHKYLVASAALALFMIATPVVFSQHEGHVMPNVSKTQGKTRPRLKRKRRATVRRKQTVRRSKKKPSHEGMKHLPPVVTSPQTETAKPQVVPGSTDQQTVHPQTHAPSVSASPEETAVPAQHETHPKAEVPAVQSPEEKPTQHIHPTPSSTPAAAETRDHSKMPTQPESGKEGSPGDHSTHIGPLLVMTGDRMNIRVGASDTNLLPMGQMGSGTSWQPASSPTYMLHKQSGDWLLMFHYNTVMGVNSQGGPRGVTKVESANWFMPMALRQIGKGTLELRGMLSLEPFTFPPGGSPLLFQTGETYKGQPIIDRQHPHDFFMELSGSYTLALGEHGTWFTYLGYPGEPALGPAAFMHRASASENSSAPLSHHLQDSSHISFGVFTTGFSYRWLKLEASIFNGREPDERRYNFEAHPWNSRAARLSVAPNSNWTIQVSHGLLRNPEALEPGDVRRTTASVSYNRPIARGNWATSLIWGRNYETHSGERFKLNGYVAESTLNFLDHNYLYTRLELVDKNQLLREADRLQLGITDHHPAFRIGAYTFGGARDIFTKPKISVAVGSDVTFYSKPDVLNAIYGNNPVSWKVFLRVRPGKMDHRTH